ncbi:cGMP-specific 3',5'-cyclic phosphodiesterase [Octopus bimaculoides]|uniref:Phosphodiesterase n=1 Tax=Octopus bimaculoides TaxID=37653 RepID=A0A0L8GBU9_OCTBM|nr:cGMP-specific 3',5'-cyclic phosphodiesterase [Octopus bimaculoides]|eukprot:XP_014782379.1 PREDICTED: cGMP-specific 3',5'-cyclic phosphodiesterase-like [Octopus bimaculoides]
METEFTEEAELTQEEVDDFLVKNPIFVRSWLSRRGLGDLGEELYNQKLKEEAMDSFIDFLQNLLFHKKLSRRNQLESLTTNEMYKEILKVLNSEIHIHFVCHKVLQNLCILLQCEKANLFMVRGAGKIQYLTSTLFDVTAESTLEESLHTEENAIRVPFGKDISGYVAQSKCLLNIKDAYQDPRFLSNVDEKTGFRTKSILCVPILDSGDNLLAVAQIMNKKDNHFDSEDEIICESFLSFCAISMRCNNFLRRSFEEYAHHKLLLRLNRCILKYQNSLMKLISEITKLAMEMLQCESIIIYLSDPKKDSIHPTETSKVFQLLKGASDISEEIITPKIKLAIEQNINSGNTLDMFLSREFIEQDTIDLECKIESQLICLAIKDASKNFVGWIVYSKDSRDIFSQNDISLMEIFAMFCGLAIYNCRLYETAANMLDQIEFTNKVLSYYTTCDPEIVDHFLSMEVLSSSFYKIYRFDFNDFLYSEDDSILLVVRIFLEAKTLSVLNIPKKLLYRWILTVKKNYRPVIYHNWRHAINVTQMMFCMLTTGKLQIYFTEFDQICLLMASLCHDLDHRGYNNAFQVKTASPLATLYSTSVLENHHIDRSIMILKNEDTNILQNVSAEKYQHGLKLIEKAIIATDLVIYFERRNIFKRKIEVDDQTLSSQESIDLLISMMMTASDLSAITKPWDVQRKTAIMVAAEFFEQGDFETQCKYTVLPMMDRNKRYELPKMQVGFIDFVCTIVYKLLYQVREELKPLYDGMLENRAHWSDIANGNEKFDIDKELELVLYNISLESAITIGDQLETEDKGISTQTILTFDRKQMDTQTDISIPADICQPETTRPSLKTVETKTVDSQTENRTLEVSSALTQTERASLRESEHLPIVMPHEQPVINIETSEDADTGHEKVFLQRKAHSTYAQPTQAMPVINRQRRTSWIDEVAEDKRNELSQSRRGSHALNALPEEPTQPFRRMNRVFQPPVRQRLSSLEPEYIKSTPSNETIISDVNTQMTAKERPFRASSVDSQEMKAQNLTEKQESMRGIEKNTEGCRPQVDPQLKDPALNSDKRRRKCAKITTKPNPTQKLSVLKSRMCMIS